tara:strand:- start:415 stop:567 length:153 start_codon:yes stop_codon:yes gene_type:complete
MRICQQGIPSAEAPDPVITNGIICIAWREAVDQAVVDVLSQDKSKKIDKK